MEITKREDLAPYIQHTLIKVGTTREEIIRHAEEAVKYGFSAAMVPGTWVPEVKEVVKGSGVLVASALDFPTVGVTTPWGKAREAESLVKLGADQIDIGVQIGWLKSGENDRIRDDIRGVVDAAGVPIKVMLELPLLTEEEKQIAVDLAQDAGAAWLKNASSGSIERANPESIRYLVERARPGVKVKASGSITDFDQAISLIAAGAEALGTSAGIALITGDGSTESY